MIASILHNIGRFTEADTRAFETSIVRKRIKKNEVVLQEGQTCQSAFYIVSGSFYQFCYDDIDENIIDLHLPNEWVLNHSSFMTQKPSQSIIKAFSEAEILELSVHAIHELITKSPIYLQLGKILDQAATRIHFFDNASTPQQKYNYVMDNRPQLLHVFPLKMIASYLKITPETLSRVRSLY